MCCCWFRNQTKDGNSDVNLLCVSSKQVSRQWVCVGRDRACFHTLPPVPYFVTRQFRVYDRYWDWGPLREPAELDPPLCPDSQADVTDSPKLLFLALLRQRLEQVNSIWREAVVPVHWGKPSVKCFSRKMMTLVNVIMQLIIHPARETICGN